MSAALARAQPGRAPTLRSGHARPRSSARAAPAGTDGTPLPETAVPTGPLPRPAPASGPPGDSPARLHCIAETPGPLPERLAPGGAAIDGRGRPVPVRILRRHAGSTPDW